jgi:hypothetical protein
MPTLLGQTDIYVSTSLSGRTSVSLLEACIRCISVVSDIPSNEWISDGENDFVFNRPRGIIS